MRILRGSALPTRWPTFAILIAATCAAGIAPATAAIKLSAGTTVGVEHNDNPFEFSDSAVALANQNGGLSDTSTRLSANVAASTAANSGPTNLKLQASATHVEHDRFATLNHTEYLVGGNLGWNASRVFDVSLQGSESRAPVDLIDVGVQKSAQQKRRQAGGTLRLRPASRWQLGFSPGWSEFTTPLPGGQNFQLTDRSNSLSLDYLSAGRLIPGLLVSESKAEYSGIANATRYEQQAIQGTLNYLVSDFSKFALSVGRSKRTSHLIVPSNDPLALSLEGSSSATTGTLTYLRQLSVKTSISITAFRDFRPYDAGVNSTLGTGINAGIIWKATGKLSASLDGRYTSSTISSVQIEGRVSERKDKDKSLLTGLSYTVTNRLLLRGYYSKRMRDSNLTAAVFNGTTAGLELTATFD